LHHPAGESERLLICAVGELELFEERVGPFPPFLRGEPEVSAVKGEDLPRREREVEIGTLRHDTDQPHAAPIYNVYSQIVYALKASDVRDVMVNGQVIVRDRKMLTLDSAAVLKKAAEYQEKVQASLAKK